MIAKAIVDEDYTNYRHPSMLIVCSQCSFKCCRENNLPTATCQNYGLHTLPTQTFTDKTIYQQYINNPITKALVFGGLEPFDTFESMYQLIKYFRDHGCNDPAIIYTGYTKEEISENCLKLMTLPFIICKFGRYLPNQTPHYDDVLGVTLASDNQYAQYIS